MAVPKKRTSHSKNRMRHSGKHLKSVNIVYDKNGDPQLSHYASISGLYKGRVVVAKKTNEKEEKSDV